MRLVKTGKAGAVAPTLLPFGSPTERASPVGGSTRHAAGISPDKTSAFRAILHRNLDVLESVFRNAEQVGRLTPFQHFDWLESLIGHVANVRGAETFTLQVLDEADSTVMLLPLTRRIQAGGTTISIVDFGVCDFLAPVLTVELTPENVPAAWHAVRSVLPKADVFEIARMPRTIAGRPNPLLQLAGVREMASTRQYGLPIAPPVADLIARSSKASTFRDFAKYRRRLERQGAVRYVVARTAKDLDDLLGTMFLQRRERFKTIGRDNLMALPEIERFYRDAAVRGLTTGPVRVGGLSVGGEWVGTSYGLVHGGSFALVAQTMAGGKWRNFSPGILTTAAAMEWAAGEELTYFDFTIGSHGYKFDLGATEAPLFELAEALSLRGAAVLRLRDFRRWMKTVALRHPGLLATARSLRAMVKR